MSERIQIVPYCARWSSEYRLIADRLRTIVPDNSELHHIGSTAVANMSAKNVIDIQLGVSRLSDVQIERFESVGFTHLPDRTDHQPPGRALPPEDLRKLYFRAEDPAVHLHIRERGRFNHRYAILCRDFLRANSEAAAAYERIKLELADRFPSEKEAYYAIKDPVFDLIMTGAELWAKASNWKLPPPD